MIETMHRSATALAGWMLAAALAAGCGADAPAPAAGTPAWIDLAQGYRPPPLAELAGGLEARVTPPRGGRIVPGTRAEELWFELPLAPEGWTRQEDEPWTWRRPLPTGGAMLAAEASSIAVLQDGEPLKQGRPRQARAGRFWNDGVGLFVTTEEDAEPSAALTLRARLDAGREVDGRWRVAQWDVACDGMLVFPGVPTELALTVPADSALRFASVAPDPGGRGDELAATTFRVSLDGAPLLEHAQRHAVPSRADFHALELPAGPHRLRFEVEGPAPALIAEPRLGPRAIGRPGARPWHDPRPDLVLVLCDTFRADNLAAYGGDPALAPHLNRFVEGSLRFLDARSAAAWTLPSIASILSGVFPGQHGGTDMDRGVTQRVETVAEVLGRAGYRTIAQTDSGLFSRHYGQDQGFQWFEETMVQEWNLNATLARARAHLDDDDGRPVFLVVHTYRVHGPMRVGPDEDRGPLLALRAELHERTLERQARGDDVGKAEVAMEFLQQGLGFYANAVQDLDAKVGPWIEALEAEGFLEHGNVILTADHGNSHGEHEQIGHGGDLYDVKLRVPLAIAGRGIEPRAVRGGASLIHLAPTLAELAGARPSPTWVGRSLLGRDPSGPLFAFDLRKRNQQLALYADGHKLVSSGLEGLREGKALFAFDLAQDPGEDHNLAGSAPWPSELGRGMADALVPFLAPMAEGETLELSPEMQEQLRAIGYGGGGDDD